MKKIAFGIILLLVFAYLISCGNQNGNTNKQEQPGSLLITAEIPSEYPIKLSAYSLVYHVFDEQHCINVLMENGYDSVRETTVGPYYLSQNKEMLQFHTSEQSFHGGLQYARLCPPGEVDTSDWKNALTYISNLGNASGYLPLNSSLYPYLKTTIGDISLDEVEHEIVSLLEDCGFPPLELKESIVRDYETLNRNMEISNEVYSAKHRQFMLEYEDAEPYQPNEYKFSEKDEDVRMVFRETIDGIPLIDKDWMYRITGNGIPITGVTVCWNEREGVSNILATALFDIDEKLETVDIMEPQAALDYFFEEYDKSIHAYISRLTGIELNYITLREGESFSAVPAWIFTLEHDVRIDDTYSYVAYKTTAVNAATGEILQTMDRKE